METTLKTLVEMDEIELLYDLLTINIIKKTKRASYCPWLRYSHASSPFMLHPSPSHKAWPACEVINPSPLLIHLHVFQSDARAVVPFRFFFSSTLIFFSLQKTPPYGLCVGIAIIDFPL